MKTHHLIVQKTARIYTLGQLSDKTKNIWLVLHGYAMLSQYFIKKFDQLDLEENFIIAPEGLSKFYQSGLNGKIGASWMTSEDREHEIQDYVQYLETVYQNLIHPHIDGKNFIALGFSQGASTLMRWANKFQHPYSKIILWAGTISQDVLENYQLNHINIQIYYGSEDPLITQEQFHSYLQKLNEHHISYQSFEYQGGHAIDKEVIHSIMF